MNGVADSVVLDSTITWQDPKRHLWPLTVLWVLSPVASMAMALRSGNDLRFWTPVILTYLVFPILDMEFAFGRDIRNPPEGVVPELELERDRYYSWMLYLAVPCHYVTLFTGAWVIGTHSLSVLSYIAVAWSCGLMNGFGVATAHELGHKPSKLDRWLAKITLAAGFYGQYMMDHNVGHHRDVATPEDSGSARFAEGFWEYALLRQIPHSCFIRPWQLEKTLLEPPSESTCCCG